MEEQKPITQRQVELLIEGTLEAYPSLLNLNGLEYSTGFSGGNFQGMNKVTLNVAGTLDQIVGNMLGLTLNARFEKPKPVAVSNVYTLDGNLETNSEGLLENFQGEIDSRKEEFLDSVKIQSNLGTLKVRTFQRYTTELDNLLREGNEVDVTDCVSKISEVALWSTTVDIGALYQSAKAMRNLAADCYSKGFDAAGHPTRLLNMVLQGCKVQTNNLWGSIGLSFVEPNQTYTKKLNYETIARDLIRNSS